MRATSASRSIAARPGTASRPASSRSTSAWRSGSFRPIGDSLLCQRLIAAALLRLGSSSRFRERRQILICTVPVGQQLPIRIGRSLVVAGGGARPRQTE